MAKYNEIMERIQVTDEIRNRVLDNVNRHFKKRRVAKRRACYMTMGGIAAAAALVAIIRPWNLRNDVTVNPNPSSVVMGIFDRNEYSSIKELSDAIGFDVPEIKSLPFKATEVIYTSIGKDLAEIDYSDSSNRLTFRKSTGNDDNSGDYNTYKEEKQIDTGKVKATIKGEDGLFNLAVWTDSGYSYSIYIDKGVEEKTLLQMIEDTYAE